MCYLFILNRNIWQLTLNLKTLNTPIPIHILKSNLLYPVRCSLQTDVNTKCEQRKESGSPAEM